MNHLSNIPPGYVDPADEQEIKTTKLKEKKSEIISSTPIWNEAKDRWDYITE